MLKKFFMFAAVFMMLAGGGFAMEEGCGNPFCLNCGIKTSLVGQWETKGRALDDARQEYDAAQSVFDAVNNQVEEYLQTEINQGSLPIEDYDGLVIAMRDWLGNRANTDRDKIADAIWEDRFVVWQNGVTILTGSEFLSQVNRLFDDSLTSDRYEAKSLLARTILAIDAGRRNDCVDSVVTQLVLDVEEGLGKPEAEWVPPVRTLSWNFNEYITRADTALRAVAKGESIETLLNFRRSMSMREAMGNFIREQLRNSRRSSGGNPMGLIRISAGLLGGDLFENLGFATISAVIPPMSGNTNHE